MRGEDEVPMDGLKRGVVLVTTSMHYSGANSHRDRCPADEWQKSRLSCHHGRSTAGHIVSIAGLAHARSASHVSPRMAAGTQGTGRSEVVGVAIAQTCLHVGAVHPNATGTPVDPDAGTFDPATKTVGANAIFTVSGKKKTRGASLHHTWDLIPTNLMADHVNTVRLAQAKAVPATPGDVYARPTVWATDSLGQAQDAFSGLHYGAESGGQWTVALPGSYSAKMAQIRRRQLTEGGARLAQILRAIWR